jgi:hypothetical protein
MAVMTGSSFDPLKSRANVRLQQSVPIADADWNERDDIRQFDLRAILKWFVGDGLPDGSMAFRIDPLGSSGAPDDFIIRAGGGAPPVGAASADVGLRFCGHALADGLRAMISADLNYNTQPLVAAAGASGIPQIQPIPVIAAMVLAYLDIWERLITATDDPTLMLRGVGVETCARTIREWAVRTRASTSVPVAGENDFIAGHSYLALALINRKLSAPNVPAAIVAGDITDVRRAKLSLAAVEKRIAFLEAMLYPPIFGPVGGQVIPKTGSAAQVVDLKGRNFNIPPVSVRFGNTQATVNSIAANDVKATVPSLPAGVYPISITTGGGGPVTAADTFTVT